MSSVQGKVAVVTGAASGIGRQLAVELARRGARLAVSDAMPRRWTCWCGCCRGGTHASPSASSGKSSTEQGHGLSRVTA
jgi:NAD(P)-dependent dehydrogenase (short-subunit alcohol dehydrogenase family)